MLPRYGRVTTVSGPWTDTRERDHLQANRGSRQQQQRPVQIAQAPAGIVGREAVSRGR